MKRSKAAIIIIGGVAAAVLAMRAAKTAKIAKEKLVQDRAHRWHFVTVNLPIDKVRDRMHAGPLEKLRDIADIEVREAPAGRGTEIGAQIKNTALSGSTLKIMRRLKAVRRALRDAKEELETGEILKPDEPPTTRRTLLSLPLDYMTRHGREEGRL